MIAAKHQKTALYRHFGADGALLYVGVSLSHVARLSQHSDHSHWYSLIASVKIEYHESREAALIAEREAIIKEKPLHNIKHKNGKPIPDISDLKSEADQARRDLVKRLVYFKPLYSIAGAASAIELSARMIRNLISLGKIGFIELPNRAGKPVAFISGWQLISFLEQSS